MSSLAAGVGGWPRMKKAVVICVVGFVLLRWACSSDGEDRLRLVTFNIEDYPKSKRQEKAAFALMAGLDASAIAVQEITEPERFADAARQHLGETWRFVRTGAGKHRVGLLYDSERFLLDFARDRNELIVYPGAQPALEVRLLFGSGGSTSAKPLRVFVAHLKAGARGIEPRRRQLAALAPLLERAARDGDRVVLLGDLNSTSNEDRQAIEDLATRTALNWATREVGCTCFWDRKEDCVGWPLDHILTSLKPRAVFTRGPCAEGCEARRSCPLYRDEVSDHCPVAVDL